MKNCSLLLLLVLVLFSCSSSKEIAQESSDTSGTLQTKSYGPKGQIVSTSSDDAVYPSRFEKDSSIEHMVEIGDTTSIITSDALSRDRSNVEEREGYSKYRDVKFIEPDQEKPKKDDQWQPYRNKRSKPSSRNGFAIAGFVMSFFWPLFPIALVFSILGLKSERRGLAIAGIVLTSLFLFIVVLGLVLSFA